MAALILDGVIFEEFELPEEVALGGKQAGRLHKMPGGLRVFDGQGPDDDPIKWQGRFRGANAMARAMQLDVMRRAGGLRELMVLGLVYRVFISSFEFRPQRGGLEIPYSICVEVIENLSFGGADITVASLAQAVASDVAAGLAALS